MTVSDLTVRLASRWASLAETAVYSYDALGQLLSARIQSASGAVLHEELFTYAYDQSEGYQGNIAVVNRNGNAYEYEYSTGWSDQLLRVKDSAGNLLRSYTYDAIGNPTSDGSRGYEWSCGRLLTKVSAGSTTVATYTYDGGGERIGKTAGGVSHEYWQEDGRILSEKLSGGKSATLNYYYGQDGLEYIVHNGAQYWALKNLQGDIVGLAQIQANGAGTLVCRYRYSAFGELLSVTDAGGSTITDTNHIAHLNPFRYRGYYYDAETGFYATGTRYYDPFIGRFINADSSIPTGQGALGNNLFTYCLNNPIILEDADGEFAVAAGTIASGAAIGGANAWNPVGWVILGATAIAAVAIWTIPWDNVGKSIFNGRDHTIATAKTASRMLSISKAVSKAKTKIRKERDRYDYWIALYVDYGNGRGTYIPTTPLSYSSAISYVRAGGSVFADSRRNAYKLARAVGYGKKPKRPERHSADGSSLGFWWHYHDRDRIGGHIFYV